MKREIDEKIAERADKSEENGIAIDKQMALLGRLESWLAEQEVAEKNKRQQVLLKTDPATAAQVWTSKQLGESSLHKAYEWSSTEITRALETQTDLLNLIQLN